RPRQRGRGFASRVFSLCQIEVTRAVSRNCIRRGSSSQYLRQQLAPPGPGQYRRRLAPVPRKELARMNRRPCFLALLLAALAGPVAAQHFPPPDAKPPDEATLKAIAEKPLRLGQAIDVLRRQGLGDPHLAEVQIFHKAATWVVRHNEFFPPTDGSRTL